MTARSITYVVEFSLLFLVWLSFTVSYHIVSKGAWRRSPVGRHLMAMGVSLSVIGAQIIINLFLGQYPGRFIIGVCVYGLMVLVGIQRLVLLWQARRQQHEANGRHAA